MKKQILPDRYIFPAVLTNYGEGKEIAVDFPDLGAATSGIDEADAYYSARECLGMVLCGMEEDGESIPQPTPIAQLKLEPNETATLIDVYMPSVRLASVNKAVNKTVTLPAWLNAAAMERGINFSQVLQESLLARVKG